MHQYKELKIWQKAMELVSAVYDVTTGFPDMEKFGLVSQMRRSAVSIPSNIAEGAGRNSKKEFLQFLAIAHSSLFELETQLLICQNLGFLSPEVTERILQQSREVQKMSFAFQANLKSNLNSPV